MKHARIILVFGMLFLTLITGSVCFAAQAQWKVVPQFCLVLRETVLKPPAPYSLLHLTRSPSSLHEIHTQHRVITFCLTYKSKLSYLHSLKRECLSDRTTPGLEPKSTIKYFFSYNYGGFGVTLGTSKVLDARHRRSAD